MKITRKNVHEALSFLSAMVGLWICLVLTSALPNNIPVYASSNNPTHGFNSTTPTHGLNSVSVYRNDYNLVNMMGETNEGTLLFKQNNGMTYDGNNFFRNYRYSKATKVNIDVAMTITGMVNRVNVTQTFSNTTDNWQEGIYVFPLPEDAAVDHM